MSRRQSKDEFEVYRTPAWAVWRLQEALPPWLRMARTFCDPCCGDGALHEGWESGQVWHRSADREWTQLDKRYTSVCDGRVDYIELREPAAAALFDVAIFNPPFSLALEFVQQARRHCGVVIMLQRCNWLASASRNEWLRGHTPAQFVLPNRPDFTGMGGDSNDYAWFVWGLGHSNVTVLDTTPAGVRRAQKPTRKQRKQREAV